MAWAEKAITSIFGRRLGLQTMSSAQTGTGVAGRVAEFLVGAEQVRSGVTTAESTSTAAPAHGVSFFPGTSAASSAVYTIDPPIPGVQKFVVFNSTANGPIYLKTANGETFLSTQGTTFSIIKSTNNQVGTLHLVGLTTSVWGLSANGLSTSTFALSTTT
jgi:hypothetical protein